VKEPLPTGQKRGRDDDVGVAFVVLAAVVLAYVLIGVARSDRPGLDRKDPGILPVESAMP